MAGDEKQSSRTGKTARDRSDCNRPSGIDAAARRVVDAMTGLLDVAASDQGFTDLDPAILNGVSLFVGHGLSGRAAVSAASADLARRARDTVRQSASGVDNWRSDRVYCFQCESPDCIHVSPSVSTDVFSGYLPTGKPGWIDFSHLCMERGVDDTGSLFNEKAGVVGMTISGSELNADLLEPFVDPSYTVLGCVNAGLIPSDFEPVRAGTDRSALSLAVVAVLKGQALTVRLCRPGLDTETLDYAAGRQGHRGTAERLRRLLASVGARLDAITLAARHNYRISGPEDVPGVLENLEASVMPVLNGLRSDIVAIFSGVDSRTKHGEYRLRSGARPTSSAFTDAEAATDEHLYFDSAEKTIIVTGPRGRCHVFSGDGRLITSIKLEPGERESRLARKRWRPMEPDEIKRFRQAVSRRRSRD